MLKMPSGPVACRLMSAAGSLPAYTIVLDKEEGSLRAVARHDAYESVRELLARLSPSRVLR